MEVKHGENGTSEDRKNSNIGNLEGQSRSLGAFSSSSSEHGHDEVRASRENSQQGNSAATERQSLNGITGKIAGQLITETEKQLAYHEQQVEVLKDRLKELKDFTNINESE